MKEVATTDRVKRRAEVYKDNEGTRNGGNTAGANQTHETRRLQSKTGSDMYSENQTTT